MKKFLFILLIIALFSCITPPYKQPHDHLIVVNRGTYNTEYYYIVGDIEFDNNNCATFNSISNKDFKSLEEKKVCGTFIVEY